MRRLSALLTAIALLTACSSIEEQAREDCVGSPNPAECIVEARVRLADRQREIARELAEASRDNTSLGLRMSGP